jgi:hypothetical protein
MNNENTQNLIHCYQIHFQEAFAQKIESPIDLSMSDGKKIRLESGDYIVHYPDGRRSPVTQREFSQSFSIPQEGKIQTEKSSEETRVIYPIDLQKALSQPLYEYEE